MKLGGFLKDQSKRIMMAKTPIEKLRFPIHQENYGMKPKGLWCGFGDSWIRWCKSEMPEWIGEYYYVSEVNENKILQLKDFIDIGAFTKHYKSWSNRDGNYISNINWLKVSKEYSGIEINPYVWKARMEPKTIWYYGWDVASGCIWAEDAIKSFKEV